MSWWKAPVLQGEENDYGQYDYLIEDIPTDDARWNFDIYKMYCDSCGKYRHIVFCENHYFHTLDGWDSMGYNECLWCMINTKISSKVRKINKKIRAVKYTLKSIIKDKKYNIKYINFMYRLYLKL